MPPLFNYSIKLVHGYLGIHGFFIYMAEFQYIEFDNKFFLMFNFPYKSLFVTLLIVSVFIIYHLHVLTNSS